MYGFPAGDGAYAGHLVQGWRAVVLTSTDIVAQDAPQDRTYSMVEVGTAIVTGLDAGHMASENLAYAGAAVTSGIDISSPMSISAQAVADVAMGVPVSIPTAVGAATAARMKGRLVASFPSSAITRVAIRAAAEPDLVPLQRSWEANDIEKELKALFKQLFDTYIRPDERYVNLLGTPHLGSYELLHSSLAADGLSIYQGGVSGMESGIYLLRAWRAHNPKRGLHLLKTYLQLLWPNVWQCSQMYQDKGKPYPTALSPVDGGNHFLTSRVHVSLPARSTNGSDLNSVQYGLRATLPARFVLNFSIEQEDTVKDVCVGATVWRGFVSGSFKGTVK